MPMPDSTELAPVSGMNPETLARLASVRVLALDVDGVLTDGGVYFDDSGGETKRFHIHDGLGIVLAGLAGLIVIWITGRKSPIVERRATELKVPYLRQGVRDKVAELDGVLSELGIGWDAVAFMGDDLNDLPAMRRAGVAFAPANASSAEVRAEADGISPRAGGSGAVRDAIEVILKARGDWETTLNAYLRSLQSVEALNPVQ